MNQKIMRKCLLSLLLVLFFCSCDKKSKVEKIVEEIPVEIKVERFDQAFFEAKPENLLQLKQKYPLFFPQGTEDAVWIEKMQHPQWRELYQEVQKKYKNFDPVAADIATLFKHIKFYFPKIKNPKVVTLIGEMDYNTKTIYADSLVLVSLELYLGKQHRFYQFPEYIKQNFEQNQIVPDIASSFLQSKIPPATDKAFLSQMIAFGKELYVKELLLPDFSEADIMGYTAAQQNWCLENEGYIWRYFIDKEMLYSVDAKLIPRFISPAPFSKFYLEIDNDSPGQVGAWIGWQMVRSYMKNNDSSLEAMLAMSAKEIFEKSKYKPKK
ncbi:protein involved in gliding motility GldB [Flavobacterium succinicans]|uniref:Protein involved in gliding motility GldB n=2 Tax=Flavobacterium succinicans TaxID=29536 RepID=A0A1I4S3T9_9FLAO|nr:gliding motility lipoprotein GldB [Flavobacterium succinicans]SFM59176.1 protein involved in gliding motility GldB [Flavobacterium succinicans]